MACDFMRRVCGKTSGGRVPGVLVITEHQPVGLDEQALQIPLVARGLEILGAGDNPEAFGEEVTSLAQRLAFTA